MNSSIRITCVGGRLAGQVYELDQSPATIGRDFGCKICIADDPLVSRNHAQIYAQADSWWITDTGSSNGTTINGQRLSQPTQLKEGDQIVVGSQQLMVASDSSAPQQPATPSQLGVSCVRCGGSQTTSLQAVVSSGSFSSSGTSVSIGAGHVLGGGPNAVGGSVGAQSIRTKSDLVKLLAFPYTEPKPVPYTDKVASSIGCLAVLLSGPILGALLGDRIGIWLVLVIALVIGALLYGLVESLNKEKNLVAKDEHEANQDRHKKVYEAQRVIYERALYCPACFIVFDPSTGKHLPADQLKSLLTVPSSQPIAGSRKSFAETYNENLAYYKANPGQHKASSKVVAGIALTCLLGLIAWGVYSLTGSSGFGHDKDRDMSEAKRLAKVVGKFREGTSINDIEASLGQPTSIKQNVEEPDKQGSFDTYYWELDGASHTVVVDVQDGRMIDAQEDFESSDKYPHCDLQLNGDSRCWDSNGEPYQ